MRLKHHEFWPPRLFELPFYLYLALLCIARRIGPRQLARANYALDHGEIGLGSKYRTQQTFSQQLFPRTEYLPAEMPLDERIERIHRFASENGLPLILKPDIGITGKGLIKIVDTGQLEQRLAGTAGGYLLQTFCDLPEEYGVFYVRLNGEARITGINRKHYPAVTGDGEHTIGQLARMSERYSGHWQSFLQYVDVDRVPAAGEVVVVSFIGSHTLGCLFTDESELCTPELQEAVCRFVGPVGGYNFGRLDVKARDEAALGRGEFTVIEVNGVSSLPTHMYDPKYNLLESYRIFFEHGRYLVQAAVENRKQPMALKSLLEITREVRVSQRRLNQLHRAQQSHKPVNPGSSNPI